MTQEEKEDKKLPRCGLTLDDDYYWNSFYIAHLHAGWRCVDQNNDD